MEHHEDDRVEDSVQAPVGRDGSQVADMQSAIFDVVACSRGRRVEDVKRMLQAEFERRQVTPQSGLWLDAVATSAALGKPYIISNEALWATEAGQDTGAQRLHTGDA